MADALTFTITPDPELKAQLDELQADLAEWREWRSSNTTVLDYKREADVLRKRHAAEEKRLRENHAADMQRARDRINELELAARDQEIEVRAEHARHMLRAGEEIAELKDRIDVLERALLPFARAGWWLAGNPPVDGGAVGQLQFPHKREDFWAINAHPFLEAYVLVRHRVHEERREVTL